MMIEFFSKEFMGVVNWVPLPRYISVACIVFYILQMYISLSNSLSD